ncbi:MAG: hypothetical protein ACSLE9_07375 [Burkholderiaceae bacterium]
MQAESDSEWPAGGHRLPQGAWHHRVPRQHVRIRSPCNDRQAERQAQQRLPAYDKWFREQVQAAIDDPRPSIPDDDVRRESAARRLTRCHWPHA